MFIKKQHVDVRKSAQKVLEPKRDSLSRLKHLRVYLDNVETAEAKTFFEINYSHIYCIFHDVFTSLEGMLRQRVHKTQKEELDNVKYIFERILVLLPELLAQRWQWHSIRIIIRKFLHPGNSLRLRREGVRFFLLWYQILGEGAPSDIHAMFLHLVPGLLPGSPPPVPAAGSGRFPEPYQDSTFYTSVEVDSGPIVPCDSGPLMPPQSGEVQPENPTVTFLEFLMEYMVTQATKIQWSEAQDDNHHRCFEFLFEKFKKHFLPHIFPDFCYSNSIYKPNLVSEGYHWVCTSLELPSLRKDKKPAAADSNAAAVAALCRSVVVQWVVSHTQPAKLRKDDAAAASRSSDLHQARKQDHNESGLERISAPSGSSGGMSQNVHESHSVSSGSSSAPSLTIGSLTERDSENQLQQTQQSPPESGHRSLRQIQVVRNVLYSKRENVNLVHEVLRQAFLAPFSQAHTTKSVICTYRDWIQMASPDMPPFLVDPEGKDGKEDSRSEVSEMSQSTSGTTPVKKESVFAGVQNMYQVFITNAANVFLLEVGPDEKTFLDEQVELCKRVMNIYRYMVMKRHMEKATWEQLLVVLLRVTSLVLKTTPPARKEDVLGGRLAPALFQTLIVTWIKANLHATISLDLWDGFLGVLSSLTQWEELIHEWAKTMETLTRILAQHVYRLNLSDLPLQREQQNKRRRGLKHNAGNAQGATARTRNDVGKGDDPTTGGGSANEATSAMSSTNGSVAGGMPMPLLRASPSLAESRDGNRETGVPLSPRLRTASMGRQLSRIEDDDRNSDRARCNSGDSSLPSHHGDRASEKPPPVVRCYSDGHLLLHKVERLRRMRRAHAAPAQDRFDITSVSSDTNIQSDGRLCPLGRSKSADYLSLRVESPCMSHTSEYRSRSPSPTPSSGLESTSIKDSPIQIEVIVTSSENTCNAADVGPGTDRRSVLAGGSVKGWLPEVAVVLWRRMLGALGNVNAIRDPLIHAQVMEHLIDLSETLIKMRDNLGITEDNMTTPPPPTLIPPLLLIAPWLFEATGLPEGFEKGKLLALRLLCWLTVRRHDIPLSFDYLARFYRVLHAGLLGEDQKVINAIVKYCGTKFFASRLPGHTVLLLNFIHGASTIVTSNAVKGMPRVEAVTLLGSLVCFPNVYTELQVLQCSTSEPPQPAAAATIKELIVDLLLKAGKTDPDGVARCTALSALGIFAYEELSHRTGHPKAREAIGVLLLSIRHHNHTIAQVAGDMLRLLCDHAAHLTGQMDQVPAIVVEVVASTIHNLLPSDDSDVKEENKKLVLSLLFCLADWCMNIPLRALTTPQADGCSPLLSTLNVLDHILTGKSPLLRPDVLSLLQALCPSIVLADIEAQPGEGPAKATHTSSLGHLPSGGKIARSIASFVPPAVLQSDFRKSGNVKLAARMVLSHLLHQLGHFPMGLGAAQLTSLVAEQDDVPALRDSELSKEVFSAPNIQLFVLNNMSILSLVEIPAEETSGGAASVGLTTGKSQVRAIVRDLSGKFSWDCLTLYGPHGCRAGSYPPGPVPDPCLHYTTHRGRNQDLQEQQRCQADAAARDSGRRSPLHRPPDQLPLLENTQDNYDNLDDLLQYIGHTSPECVQLPCQRLNSAPKATDELAGIREAETVHLLLNQHAQEVQHTAQAAYSPEMLAKAATPPNPTEPLSPFQYSRLLLENFNFFAWEKRPKFDLVKKNEKLLRELRNLDNQMCRETHKIAVIYVAEGQEDKNSIFMNNTGSRAFEEFVAGLGWEVDLEVHTGYNGGLETNKSTGSTAPYYATSFMEVLFHVSTRIPAIEKDSITKKLRHLGNDEVHIVWSEHMRDYRRGIIPTEFCDVLIVIYPLGNWLYRVQINPKPEVPFFGPLFDGAIVDHLVLPRLVRATAINAGRAVNSLKPMFRTYYEQRAQALETVVQNYKELTTFEDFASKVMAPAPAKSPLVLRRSAGPSGSEGGSPQLGSTLAAALLDSDSGSPSMQHHHPRPRPATVSSSAGDQGSFSFREHHAIPASQSHSSSPVPN
ncbi:probable Rho GTPase-activating protein CG5521 isoform X1 [Rhipicephalus sanguineus]|uniref:probable Rho GTPase-activating protein CG5521 isoform X1 n=1 Tax=Rhipicephalus sanguineus TaxID=34632 RepID=UPI0018934BBC|nr:probable Rho GTPase-activating protein CG5521 isoform X1 [Rhipicephalus sanguineus]